MKHDFWPWVDEHAGDDTSRLRLKYGTDRALEILQIECRRKYAAKFARTLAANPRFLFPDAIAAEQATSDRLAAFHATLIGHNPRLLDLTAGLGIDAMTFAAAGASVVAVEQRHAAADALAENARGLDLTVRQGDSTELLRTLPDNSFDTIYVDPARRLADGHRAFALADCQPDVPALLPQIRRVAPRCIVKMSPMLDLTHTAGALGQCCHQLLAVGTTTECRELLAVLDFTHHADAPSISAVTMLPDGTVDRLDFTAEQERQSTVALGTPSIGDILYELYPAAIKAGALKLPASLAGMQKLHPNTHLYFSSRPVEGFPGTAWQIIDFVPYTSGNIKRFSKRYPRVSVAARNFGITADALRAKLRTADGGPLRAIGATDHRDQRIILVITPLQP